ncbi:hypothetical protein FQN51_004964 [Onygenales sp. PD_10]|nr:hypothetical protein FQN51_004964 [Onygenales sp. PD_10]
MNGQNREPTPPPPYASRENSPNRGNGPRRQGPNANDVYEDFAEPEGRGQGPQNAPQGIQGNNNNNGYDPFGPGGGQPQAAGPQALNFGEIAAPAPVHYNIFNNAPADPAGGLPFPFAQAQIFGQQPIQFPQLAINLGGGPGGILDLNVMAQNLLNPPPPAHLVPGPGPARNPDEPPATWAEYFAQFQFPPGQAPMIDLANLPPLPGAHPPLNNGNFGNFGGGAAPFGMPGMPGMPGMLGMPGMPGMQGMPAGGPPGMGMVMAFPPSPSPPASSASASVRSSNRSNRGVDNDRDPVRDAPVWIPWYRVLWGDCCGF